MKKIEPKQWLTELKAHSAEKYAIVDVLRSLILKGTPAIEEIKYGGLLYSNKKSYTGIFVYTNHVTLEFTEGAKLTDKAGVLSGTGKYRRNIKFSTIDEVDTAIVQALLNEASRNSK